VIENVRHRLTLVKGREKEEKGGTEKDRWATRIFFELRVKLDLVIRKNMQRRAKHGRKKNGNDQSSKARGRSRPFSQGKGGKGGRVRGEKRKCRTKCA